MHLCTRRNVLRTVEEGDLEGVSETVIIDQHKHHFKGWAQCKQLQCMRRVFGGGLTTHLKVRTCLPACLPACMHIIFIYNEY